MNTQDFVKVLAEKNGAKQAEAKRWFDSVLNEIINVTESEGSFRTSQGTFKLKVSSARKGHNPSTGEAIDIPEKKKITFNISKALKTRLNG